MTRTTGGSVRKHATRDLSEARYIGADGRRHSLYRRTERDAQQALRAALSDADHGIRPADQQLTVDACLSEWLAGPVAQRCRPSTAASYQATVRRYISPAIGRTPLAKLQPEQVARMLADLGARGDLSPTTVRYLHRPTGRPGAGSKGRAGRSQRRDPGGPAAALAAEVAPLSID
jgi:hypothetical protein